MKPIPLVFAPGVVKTDTPYSQEGRWVDSDKVRFSRGLPEKIGGWVALVDETFAGICRGLLPWRDNDESMRTAVATHCKLYYAYAGAFVDITPVADSGTLGSNPFTMVDGSAVVTVADTSHGLEAGTGVSFSGASAAGGITVDGDYTVTAVLGSDSYTITHSAAATSDATGGGGSVAYVYDLNCGRQDAVQARGYGVGGYGVGTYGTPRATSFTINPRTWTLSPWGEDLIACPRGGSIYKWAPGDTVAAVVSNAPTQNKGAFVTPERHLVALGAGGNPLQVDWCDQENRTVWTPTASNTAGSFTLNGGNEIVGGGPVREGINLVWTDASAWIMRLIDQDFVFGFTDAGDGTGLMAPLAFAVHLGVCYWMSDGEFLMYDGAIRAMPRSDDIRDFVFGDINRVQRHKVHAGVNVRHGEIWFHWPSAGATEVDRYAIYSVTEQVWATGTIVRTAWAHSIETFGPIATDADGYLYEHETGNDAAGAAMDAFITSAPMDLGDGEAIMDVWGLIPDFKDQAGNVAITLLTRDKPNSTEITDGPYTAGTATEIIDTRASGRQVAVRIRSNAVGGHFRLGKMRAEVAPSGARR